MGAQLMHESWKAGVEKFVPFVAKVFLPATNFSNFHEPESIRPNSCNSWQRFSSSCKTRPLTTIIHPASGTAAASASPAASVISLGSFVVHKLRQHGAKDVFVPRRADHDLVQADAIRRLLSDACPDVVIHLAARVVSIEVTAADTPSGHRPPRAYPVQGTSQGHRRGDEDGLARKGILA